MYPPMNPREEFEVPATVRRICNNAFQGTRFLKTLKIHNVVTQGYYASLSIGEKAFNDSSIENFVVIGNDGDVATSAPASDAGTLRKEVARYDTAGRKTTRQQKGVQVVVYDDKSAKKVAARPSKP